MNRDWLAEQFEERRSHLRAIAYRMLGSQTDADDAVQEAWLRLSRSDAEAIDNLSGWLTTVVARVCLDLLRSRDSRKEAPLPEDLDPASPAPNPADEALMAESVGLAMLVVLETLTPSERVAFVLHDTFGLSFEEIAPIVGRSPAAARQLASRARRRVQGSPTPDESAPREIVRAFLAAAQNGDFHALLAFLDPEAVMRSDPAAAGIGAPVALNGPEAVAGRFNGAKALREALIDGVPGLVWARGGEPHVVFAFTFRGDKVAAIDLIADKERLVGLDVEFL